MLSACWLEHFVKPTKLTANRMMLDEHSAKCLEGLVEGVSHMIDKRAASYHTGNAAAIL
jgi:hypothetical protein